MEDVVSEAKALAASGTKELIIVAQDTTAYGIDLYGEYKLAGLLSELCKIDGIEWIRLMYCYEDSITDELIRVIEENEKICKYIDLPLQHISDGILKAMNRKSTKESIKETIRRLREGIPGIHIRTTFITGFPGETDAAFEELAGFVSEAKFDRLGVFAYSPEEGTAAAEMPDQVDEEVKAARRDEIMEMQRQISLEKNESKIGNVLKVLIEEGPDEENSYIGRTEYDAKEIDNNVIFTSEKLLCPGNFVKVRITDAFDYDLVGWAE
jgi:ribosomal protein S12 methylthiotransferase